MQTERVDIHHTHESLIIKLNLMHDLQLSCFAPRARSSRASACKLKDGKTGLYVVAS